MEGIVEVFQIKDGCWDKVYEESNMVVHGGKVACADIFSHVPYEFSDGTTPLASSVYQSVSNYTIQSITLGAGSKTMTKRDSRHAVTKANDMFLLLEVLGYTRLQQRLPNAHGLLVFSCQRKFHLLYFSKPLFSNMGMLTSGRLMRMEAL